MGPIRLALQYLLSVIFIVQMYVALLVVGLTFLVPMLLSRRAALLACKLFCRWVCLSARWLVGLRTEWRGPVPQGDVLLVSKHQSFMDIIMLFAILPRPRFVMKRELLWVPILGQYAARIGCIAVDRGRRAAAMKKMVADVTAGSHAGGQVVIYAQGTRVAPGVKMPYKAGAGVLYLELRQDCVPVATNVGLFWPRRGLLRKPGTAVIEFLPAIPPGQRLGAFMAHVEEVVETASDGLMAEAGFRADAR